MKKIITIVIIIITLVAIFFIKINYKSLNFGNNMSNKSADEIKNYILDIKSYEVEAKITINSNKNTNEYLVKEQYYREENISKIEILEPENLLGICFEYNGNDLKIENSKLNLNKIYENYPYIGENTITLLDFVNDYSESGDSKFMEKDEDVILETKVKNGNKYIAYKKLYVNKSNGKPIRMEIEDITQKKVIYILYNEIKINDLQKEDILAFKLDEFANDI